MIETLELSDGSWLAIETELEFKSLGVDEQASIDSLLNKIDEWVPIEGEPTISLLPKLKPIEVKIVTLNLK